MQSVTLGDEEARRRGVQKSVLERKGPPTFSAAVEMISRTEWRVHRSLSGTAPVYMHLRILSASLQKFSCLVSHGGCVRRTLSKREVLQTVHWQVRLFLQSGIQCDGVWLVRLRRKSKSASCTPVPTQKSLLEGCLILLKWPQIYSRSAWIKTKSAWW